MHKSCESKNNSMNIKYHFKKQLLAYTVIHFCDVKLFDIFIGNSCVSLWHGHWRSNTAHNMALAGDIHPTWSSQTASHIPYPIPMSKLFVMIGLANIDHHFSVELASSGYRRAVETSFPRLRIAFECMGCSPLPSNFTALGLISVCPDGFHQWWLIRGKGHNTLRPRQNGRYFPDDTFLNGNVWIWIKISLKFVPKGLINYITSLVQIMAWHRSGDKPLSEPIMVSLMTQYYDSSTRRLNIFANKFFRTSCLNISVAENRTGIFSVILAGISNDIHFKVLDEIAYLFPNSNGVTIEVLEWISIFTSHFTGHVITYPYWD